MKPDRHLRLALCLAVLVLAPPAGAQLPGGLSPALPRLPDALPTGGLLAGAPASAVRPPGLSGLPGLPGLPGALPTTGAVAASSAKALSVVPFTLPKFSDDAPLIEGSLSAVLPIRDGLVEVVDDTTAVPPTGARRATAQRLLTQHPDLVEPDDHGEPVVRGEIPAVGVDAATLTRLRFAGFTVRGRETLAGLGVQTLVLGAPAGASAIEAVRRLRSLDPVGQYDFNHLYQTSGAVVGRQASALPSVRRADGHGLRIGLVDGAVALGQPSLAGAKLVQRAFAPGGSAATAHATAIASLIAGDGGAFHGAAPGATLYVADVYGPTPTGGSAEAVARALSWLAEVKAPVINISLVGPPNLLLAAAVRALLAKGHIVVAAVGNDGPAAAPLYPASYAGVVAVTGVDARSRVLPEAGRGTHVDFAAPGSEMAAAAPGGGFVAVRGTSFAAPIAAGRLARGLTTPDPAAAARAVATLGREAVDLGQPGPDPVYGRGLVGADVRTALGALPARTAGK